MGKNRLYIKDSLWIHISINVIPVHWSVAIHVLIKFKKCLLFILYNNSIFKSELHSEYFYKWVMTLVFMAKLYKVIKIVVLVDGLNATCFKTLKL